MFRRGRWTWSVYAIFGEQLSVRCVPLFDLLGIAVRHHSRTIRTECDAVQVVRMTRHFHKKSPAGLLILPGSAYFQSEGERQLISS